MSDATDANTILHGRTVLLLEDESLIVLDMRLAFEACGARLTATSDARRALELLADDLFDAAVLDLTLGDGETCEPVARRLGELGVPYLICSGDSDRHRALIARLRAPLITKPYPSHQLTHRVAELIEQRET